MTNEECMGYIIKAMKAIGKSNLEIKELLSSIRYEFDMVSESEAFEYYNKHCAEVWTAR